MAVADLFSVILGPMVAPECRRALGRGWVILVRTLGAVAVLSVTLAIVWWWWMSAFSDPGHSPYAELRIGFGVVLGMMIGGALLLGPAVMAGSIAGEKERGSLGLMLTTNVSPREIVTGRFVGKLSQVGMALLSCVPALVILGSYAGFGVGVMAISALLPFAVAIGGVGLATVASCLSRRGRDALLVVYLGQVLILVASQSSLFNVTPAVGSWVFALNPFSGIEALSWNDDGAQAGRSILNWLALGALGVALASWRLRPACLAAGGGGDKPKRFHRGFWVPPVNENRPMLWKELFIERVGSIGRFGNAVGLLLILALGGGSLILGVLAFGPITGNVSTDTADWARGRLSEWVGGTGVMLTCLIQWAIGLRASVSISSERERGTWIGLMTSPLDGQQVVRSKIWGSLHALLWLIVAAYFAWGVAAATGAISDRELMTWVASVLVGGAFMSAVGVRTSLLCDSATRAMTITMGVWIASLVVVWFGATILLLTGLMICNLARVIAAQAGLVPAPATIWFPVPWAVAYPVVSNLCYLLLTLLVVADTRLRFDRIAGRMTEGKVAVAFDQFLYGQPTAPVLAKPSAEEDLDSLGYAPGSESVAEGATQRLFDSP